MDPVARVDGRDSEHAADGFPISGSARESDRAPLAGAYVSADFVRAGNSSIIPAQAPQPVVDRAGAGVVQGYLEQSNVNPIEQMTQMITVSRAFENVTQLMRDSETSISDAIKTLGGAS